MLEYYSPQAVKLIELAESIAASYNTKIIGTEHLLLAMFDTEDTICHFLLSEEQVTKEEIEEEISLIGNNSYILENSKFTKKFNEIVSKTKETLTIFKTKYIYDEHLFYTLLTDSDNNATKILINLGLSPNELIEDILDIFNIKIEKLEEYNFLTNLQAQKEVHPYIERANQLNKLNIILNKKQKNNPMIIGSAGVGKTALVEGYARKHPELKIYRFELGSVIAGTKYRGELEEKIVKAINFIKDNKGILFIDEIHNIVGAGSNEGTLDIANILKPYISRSDIQCIGATTLDEYYKYIEKDKALMRRFHNIYIDEAKPDEVCSMLKKIKYVYEAHHQINYPDEIIDYIVKKTDKFIPNRTFPDKAIDVMDELGSIRSLGYSDKDNKKIIDEIIRDLSGVEFIDSVNNIELNYEQIKPFYISYLEDTSCIKPICVIYQNKLNVNMLIKDLEKISTFKRENYLELDLETYFDASSLTGLIGSNKGYVGYESGGILSEQLIKFPYSLIYIKNLDKAHISIQNFIKKIIKNNYFIDNKGRKIILTNSLFVISDNNKKHQNIGLFNDSTNKRNSDIYDVMI